MSAQLTGTGTPTLSNNQGLIVAGQDLTLRAQNINNINEQFQTQTVNVGTPTSHAEYQFAGSPTRYAADLPGIFISSEQVTNIPLFSYTENRDTLTIPGVGSSSNWVRYDYNRTTTQTQVTSTRPALIRAGKNLTLVGDKLTNDKSQIVAGQRLSAALNTLDNIGAVGSQSYTVALEEFPHPA